jgi:hypothetical protein
VTTVKKLSNRGGESSYVKVSDTVIEKIADLAQVSNNTRVRSRLHTNLISLIDSIWEQYVFKSMTSKQTNSSLQRIAQASAALKEELGPISLGDMEWLRISMLSEPNQASKFEEFRNAVSFFAEVTADAAQATEPWMYRRRIRGRPENSGLGWLVSGLLRGVSEAGGALTFSKADGGRGTLIAVMRTLSPYLPSGLIPAAIPMSTLDRKVAEARTVLRESTPPRRRNLKLYPP